MRRKADQDREFQDAFQKLMIMQLMQRSNLAQLAKELGEHEDREISVDEMKGLIRKHFKGASMSYDFRKQAGERDFIDNFLADAEKIEQESRKAMKRAAVKHLKVVRDLLKNFNLTLDLERSSIYRYKVGSDSWGYSGALVVKGDLPEKGIEDAIWDVTAGLKVRKLTKSGDSWVAEFEGGG